MLNRAFKLSYLVTTKKKEKTNYIIRIDADRCNYADRCNMYQYVHNIL